MVSAQFYVDMFKRSVDELIQTYVSSNLTQIQPAMLDLSVKGFYDMLLRELKKVGQSGVDTLEARKQADSHLIAKLKPIGDGYTLLEKIGFEDPLASLTVSPSDYVTGKTRKVNEILSKEKFSDVAIEYHLDEIATVGRRYKIDFSQNVSDLVRIFMEKRAVEIIKGRQKWGSIVAEEEIKTLQRIGTKYNQDPTPYLNRIRATM